MSHHATRQLALVEAVMVRRTGKGYALRLVGTPPYEPTLSWAFPSLWARAGTLTPVPEAFRNGLYLFESINRGERI